MNTRLAMLLLPLLACSSDPGPGSTLIGTWGGESGGIVSATQAGVDITLTCGARIQIAHPVVLDDYGHFEVFDSLRGTIDGGQRDTLPGRPVALAFVTGTVDGDRLTVSLTLGLPRPEPPIDPMGEQVVFAGRRGRAAGGGACRT